MDSQNSDRESDTVREVGDVEKIKPEHTEETISTVSPPNSEDGVAITAKTWLVIFILSSTFGLSFWPVPTTAAMLTGLGTHFNAGAASYWFIPAYTTGCGIGFLLAGANSDIFGRRPFLLFGNVLACLGFIVTATAKSSEQFTAGLAITGFAGGACQMAMCSIPELLPNKFRHIGVALSDGFVFLIVIIGPVVGRYAIATGNNWKYIYWGGFIAQFLSLLALSFLYFPPKHPKGVPWKEGIRGLDYIGALIVVPGIVLVLVGIINTTFKKGSDLLVIVPIVVGFVLLIAFGLWENFSNTKYLLCPPAIFKTHKGREFTVPFIVAFIVTMTYYSTNIIYPTMVNLFYITPTTPTSTQLLLSLPPNLGLVFGACLLIAFGNLCGHWKWTLCIAWTGMMLWGALIGLVTPYNKATMIAFTFLAQTFFGWAQYESIAFTQLGVHQHDLGISGGLSGVARYAGGSLAQAVYTSILTNAQTARAAATVPAAAIAAGLSSESASKLLATFPLGAAALEAIPGVDAEILAAASVAYQWSYAHALKITALSSLSFGGLGLICCLLCENIDHKMNNKTEIFLENDVNAEKNEFH